MADKITLVVIEDEPHIRIALKYNLEMDGYAVHLAKNGKEGLELVRQIHPDLVLCDWMMPEMNGLEGVSNLKGDPATRSIPVVMLTAKNMAGEKEKVLGAGADDYISKPFDPLKLGQILRTVMSRTAPTPAADRT